MWIHNKTPHYERVLDAFLMQYIDKQGPTLSMKVASIAQTRCAKKQKISITSDTFKGKSDLKKFSRKEYDSIMTMQQQQLYGSSVRQDS